MGSSFMQVRAYSETFWSRYRELGEWERLIKNAAFRHGEDQRVRHGRAPYLPCQPRATQERALWTWVQTLAAGFAELRRTRTPFAPPITVHDGTYGDDNSKDVQRVLLSANGEVSFQLSPGALARIASA